MQGAVQSVWLLHFFSLETLHSPLAARRCSAAPGFRSAPASADVAGRAQRIGQIDPPENRGRGSLNPTAARFSSSRERWYAICRRSRISPVCPRRLLMSRPACGRAMRLTWRTICSISSVSPGRKIRRISLAARRAAHRWRACWRPIPISSLLDETDQPSRFDDDRMARARPRQPPRRAGDHQP